MSLLFAVHLAVSIAMAGIIWSVQAVQYPLFARVGQRHFLRYHETHVRRIGYVVAPLMIVEAATGVALLWHFSRAPTSFVAALILLPVVWISTFAVQVPLHRILSLAWSATTARKLVHSNWIRTSAWTARAVLLLTVMLGNQGP